MFALAFALAGLASACNAPALRDGVQAKRSSAVRNLVVVVCDDLGWGDLGVQGASGWRTPHLDRMAEEGVRASACYAAQPVCSASRAALLTGRLPNRVGIAGALGPASAAGLAAEEDTLAELCRGGGLRTAIHGKWHLGARPPHLPLQHGFEEFSGVPYSHDMWPWHPESPSAWPDLPTLEGDEVVALNEDPALRTVRMRERALAFLDRHAEARFFLYLPLPMPHVPLGASPPFQGRTSSLYGDVVEEIDELVGALRSKLETLGIADETLLVFTSDNGPWLSYGKHAGSTGGLREGKGSVWEGGVRVPFLAACPGSLPAGRVVNEPVSLLDVLPTACEALALPSPHLPLDGTSVWQLLTGASEVPPHEVLPFWYGDNELQAARCGQWKVVWPHHYRKMPVDVPPPVDGRPWTNLVGTVVRTELYDLEADPGETQDLAPLHPEVVRRIDDLVEPLRVELGDRLRSRPAPGR